jgi:hypothetical protein
MMEFIYQALKGYIAHLNMQYSNPDLRLSLKIRLYEVMAARTESRARICFLTRRI